MSCIICGESRDDVEFLWRYRDITIGFCYNHMAEYIDTIRSSGFVN
ncbi:MAG: hypothetical protein HY367_03120 [Candidatus Aenigmarchaeota archaeon]|nr:hypothetical protein [Candidatus Aenigmarchaeota archaeon]